MNRLRDLLRLMRPVQWIKNSFVFTGFIFGEHFHDFDLFLRVVMAAIAFCLVSSCIYIINDIADCENDRKHPKKRARPLASGQVTLPVAIALALVLGVVGFALGLWVSQKVAVILFIYALMNVAYSFSWKNVVIVDVFCISAGFMLRILAGTVGVDIPPSKWLLLCGMMITLFLGFTKRRAEIISLADHRNEHRKVLESYGPIFLDEVIAICATGAIITYSLYTLSSETIAIHHTENLVSTVPFVIYGLFRYLFLLHHRHFGEDPTKDLMKDSHIIVSVLGWILVSFCILYGA
ncbi:MAG: Decaprenyl-phosphate phosphoribosyltransferase [Chlamydiae bacterium]|nr:Decaprenyl-phosphate phosphoribosyltransferase [Chlamydiota bacterium]